MDQYTIAIAFDEETQRWYAINNDIPIAFEDGSLDALMSRIKTTVPEVLEINNKPCKDVSLLFKVEAQAVLA
ncbi:MAG: DUF1902 domain-containing protein [Spirochaetes bacterium]|nr:DUF1902 domain-containing protein [Spirochaetota bacterium]